MEIGDLVKCVMTNDIGVIIDFNEKGEGGKDFVHVLFGTKGNIKIIMNFDLEVLNGQSKSRRPNNKKA